MGTKADFPGDYSVVRTLITSNWVEIIGWSRALTTATTTTNFVIKIKKNS